MTDHTSTTALSSQQARAHEFHRLHHDGVLVLPNAWDVASARLVEDAGAAAVATTSAGVSWSLGVPDGGHLDRHRAVEVVARTVAAVEVPVTADIETGYGDDLEQLAATIHAVLRAGAVGINLEDSRAGGLRDTAEQAERIAAVRATADSSGVALFINARTDLYLLGLGDPSQRFGAAVARAEAYVAAGADGLFVPGVSDPRTIGRLAGALPVPLNVMAGPGAPAVTQLADLGVRRVSVGMAIAQAAHAVTRRAATELLTTGTYTVLQDGLGYAELNQLVAGVRGRDNGEKTPALRPRVGQGLTLRRRRR